MHHQLTLSQKTQLTHNVWELVYGFEESISHKAGQFLLCDCAADDPKKKRSYSISYGSDTSIEFIIKREQQGTGGSVAICDQEVGHKMTVCGPLGDFVVRDPEAPKLFIGTGTGFAPLHYQIRSLIESGKRPEMHFLFGVRHEKDLFYQDVFQRWSQDDNFSYQLCVSRPLGDEEDFTTGYVTDHITTDYLGLQGLSTDNLEAYICGSPAMVKDAREKLEELGVEKERIFFEQY